MVYCGFKKTKENLQSLIDVVLLINYIKLILHYYESTNIQFAISLRKLLKMI